MFSPLKKVLNTIPLSVFNRLGSLVLTYHATYSVLPDYVSPIDNVSPETLHRQLSCLKQFYSFVSIDEFCAAKNRRGMAAVTFDDGYKCVIDEARPVLSDLGIPFTIFVNAGDVEQRVFWRHKVWFILTNGHTAACEASFRAVRPVPGKSLHQYLKDPINNSVLVEQELDKYLNTANLTFTNSFDLMSSSDSFVGDPLISYGNHTAHHYVLSSLPFAVQFDEIRKTKEYLDQLKGVQISKVFALPFGQAEHVNDETFCALRDLGYKYLLLNRNRLNRLRLTRFGVEVIERMHVMEQPINWQIKRMAFQHLIQPGTRDL